MGRLFAVEWSTRDFPKDFVQRITRAIVLQRIKSKLASPLGAMATARSATHSREGLRHRRHRRYYVEEGMAKYEPKEVDVTICVDDTLCKGVESWAWYGCSRSTV